MSSLFRPTSLRGKFSFPSIPTPHNPIPSLPTLSTHFPQTRPSSSIPRISQLPPDHTLLPYRPIPRREDFQSNFPDSPIHKIYNDPPLFREPATKPRTIDTQDSAERQGVLSAITGLSLKELGELKRTRIVGKAVKHMNKKGRQPGQYALAIVGCPKRGLVGFGQGRGERNQNATEEAMYEATLRMDRVSRYENRTFWGSGRELTSKFGATIVKFRARPAGFGLMVPRTIHPILTACGITDASATIEGSRNPMHVVKATIQLLHGGSNPINLGDGVVGKGSRGDKGQGMRSKDEIERERGRYGVDIGRRV
ncbi:hypothetical protein M231_03741 [Tremella mesenterica]|uniref:30S small subunit ribosomal protein S5 n=1 Tax=Tremella mesenterica TaxID=5217 RepID=A0A4Q1BMF4_TREME|nr:hypothetical protein M231_03741 [Tremella mesenterica]